jgi:hypothetical protein
VLVTLYLALGLVNVLVVLIESWRGWYDWIGRRTESRLLGFFLWLRFVFCAS